MFVPMIQNSFRYRNGGVVDEALPERQGFQILYISRKIELIFDSGKAIAWELS